MPSLADHPIVALFLLFGGVTSLLLLIGRLERILPRGSRIEAWAHRWAAMVQAVVAVTGLLGVVHLIYRGDAPTWRVLTAGVFIGTFWAARRGLSDWMNGVILRSEGVLKPGARVGAGPARGRIRRLGLRSAEVESEDGRLLRLPYTDLAGSTMEISSEEVAARSHTFALEIAGRADATVLMDRMMAEALLSPWSSAQPPPSVRLIDRSEDAYRFEVTVYPLDPDYLSAVEAAVRASVEP